ncbi:MAG: hypothetical protein ACK5LJ_12775, partial [Paracoccus sp. (in: a-proteobacteria)]
VRAIRTASRLNSAVGLFVIVRLLDRSHALKKPALFRDKSMCALCTGCACHLRANIQQTLVKTRSAHPAVVRPCACSRCAALLTPRAALATSSA